MEPHLSRPYFHVAPQGFERLLVFSECNKIVGKVDEPDTLAVFILRLADDHRHIHVGNQMTERITDGQFLLIHQVLTDNGQRAFVFYLTLNELHTDNLIHIIIELGNVAL